MYFQWKNSSEFTFFLLLIFTKSANWIEVSYFFFAKKVKFTFMCNHLFSIRVMFGLKIASFWNLTKNSVFVYFSVSSCLFTNRIQFGSLHFRHFYAKSTLIWHMSPIFCNFALKSKSYFFNEHLNNWIKR